MSMIAKLHPNRFTNMSPMMAAIVGCIVGEKYTEPAIAELVVTSDGFVLGRHYDDCGCNEFIGAESDFQKNWTSLLDAAGLTAQERMQSEALYRQTVRQTKQSFAFDASWKAV